MPATDPDTTNFLAKAAGGLAAITAGLAGIVWKGMNRRVDGIKGDLNTHRDEVRAELSIQRGHIAKLFDKVEDVRADMHAAERRSTDRHIELLSAIKNGGKK